jgi:uncharacterized protein (DUF362 family)
MALDLNRVLMYGNPDGTFREAAHPKPYLTIVDGVVGGEGNGPLDPDPVTSRVLICSDNPGEADAVAAKLMGFAIDRLSIVREAFTEHRWPIAKGRTSDIQVYDSRIAKQVALDDIEPALPGGFRPHFGWPGIRPGAG